ncbi:peptide/nickel transport system substrate-binding protein [Pseudonocardia hierapolitana]|uniref:Peptide/nickel transport system substrate-binding protein n=1 Tax=Pseudonocardia hierapolitana TaxID=1128676 RepID=A0A561SS60_9PSEU|nr:ABC transporter substrate-binding protein [Pseudonocardia hierapolitana]TWF77681.1 peptide/nickel transport system substrate-binding protein [Pseudonocardia hierapolitana]
MRSAHLHRCSVLTVVVTVLALFAACGRGPGTDGGTPVPDGELRIAPQFSPRSGYAIDTDDPYILTQLGVTEALTSATADGQVRPALAESWTQVDPLTWRFVLRAGVTFHDGTPLTPAAVVTALGHVAGVAAPPRALRGLGLTVVEDGANSVQVATTHPDPILPLRMSSPNAVILAASAYTGGAPSVIGTGTGPMRLTAVEGAQRASLERFDGYWGGRPALARVTTTFVTDPAARALALRAGDVDIAQGLPESSLLEFSAGSGFDEQTVAAPRTVLLLLNQSAAPFSDPRIRQAVARAVDRTALAEQALAGSAIPASELFGPAVAWGAHEPPPAPDIEGAKALLVQAGHGPDNPLPVRLWTYQNRPELPTLATAVQAMLREVGIDAEIRIGEYGTQEPEVLAGRYDMFLLSRSYLTDVPDAGATLRSDYACDGSYNLNHYCSPAFDSLVARLDTATDAGTRQDVFRAAARMLVDDVVGVPLVHSQENGVSRNVVGYTLDPMAKQLVTSQLAVTG